MAAQTDVKPWTQTRCFKEDIPEIQRLGEILEVREKARFNSEHVLHHALKALAEKIDGAA